MKKKKRRIGVKRRSVYPYDCQECGAHRIAFNHERAKERLCRRCEANRPNPDQGTLL